MLAVILEQVMQSDDVTICCGGIWVAFVLGYLHTYLFSALFPEQRSNRATYTTSR